MIIMKRAQQVQYDQDGDIIRPTGPEEDGVDLNEAIETDDLDVEIVEPVKGWGYDFLVRVQDRDDWVYYLADIETNRSEQLPPVRVTPLEKWQLEKEAGKRGMFLSEYMRQVLFGE